MPIVDLEAPLQRLPPEELMQDRHHVQAELMGDDDILLFVPNPGTVDDKFTSFFVDSPATVLRDWQDVGGPEYIQVEKSPVGALGTGCVVEYVEESPFVRLI